MNHFKCNYLNKIRLGVHSANNSTSLVTIRRLIGNHFYAEVKCFSKRNISLSNGVWNHIFLSLFSCELKDYFDEEMSLWKMSLLFHCGYVYSFLNFISLPCVSPLSVIRRETTFRFPIYRVSAWFISIWKYTFSIILVC